MVAAIFLNCLLNRNFLLNRCLLNRWNTVFRNIFSGLLKDKKCDRVPMGSQIEWVHSSSLQFRPFFLRKDILIFTFIIQEHSHCYLQAAKTNPYYTQCNALHYCDFRATPWVIPLWHLNLPLKREKGREGESLALFQILPLILRYLLGLIDLDITQNYKGHLAYILNKLNVLIKDFCYQYQNVRGRKGLKNWQKLILCTVRNISALFYATS